MAKCNPFHFETKLSMSCNNIANFDLLQWVSGVSRIGSFVLCCSFPTWTEMQEFPVGGRSLEGLKLAEYKVYLKKNGLSQTGGMDTCVDRIVLHWRLDMIVLSHFWVCSAIWCFFSQNSIEENISCCVVCWFSISSFYICLALLCTGFT